MARGIRFRLSMAGAILSSLLVACGGGGSKEAPPAPINRTTDGSAANDGGSTALDGSQLSEADAKAVAASLDNYAVVPSFPTEDASWTTKLRLVDPRDGTVLKTFVLGNRSSYVYSTRTALSVNGLRQTVGGQVALYFIQDGKVFRVSLAREADHEAHQLSTLSNACDITRLLAQSASNDTDWLLVTTPGADGTCGYSSSSSSEGAMAIDDVTVLIHSGDTASTPALPSPVAATDVLMSATQRVLVLDTASHRLALWQPGRDELEGVADGDVGEGQTVTLISPSPKNNGQFYLRVGTTLRLATWQGQGAGLQISAPLESEPLVNRPVDPMAPSDSWASTTGDSAARYFIDGTSVWKIDLDGRLSRLARLDAAPASTDDNDVVLDDLTVTDHYVVLDRTIGQTPTQIMVLDKATGQEKAIAAWSAPHAYRWILDIKGDTVLYTEYDNDTGLSSYFQLDLATGSATAITSSVNAIGLVNSSTWDTLGRPGVTHVIWCNAPLAKSGKQFNCDSDQLVSHQLSTGVERLIGTDTERGTVAVTWTNAYSRYGPDNLPQLLAAGSPGDFGLPTSWWLFDPNTAHSLKQILP